MDIESGQNEAHVEDLPSDEDDKEAKVGALTKEITTNPLVMQALQERINSAIGQSSGYIEVSHLEPGNLFMDPPTLLPII